MELTELQCRGTFKVWLCRTCTVSLVNLHLQAARMLCMFASTYLCEQRLSVMKMNKTEHRGRLTDAHLHSILRVPTRTKCHKRGRLFFFFISWNQKTLLEICAISHQLFHTWNILLLLEGIFNERKIYLNVIYFMRIIIVASLKFTFLERNLNCFNFFFLINYPINIFQ